MTSGVIVHLATFLQGGAGRAISTLARAQRNQGRDVIVATSRTPEPGFENYPEYLDAIRLAGCALVEVDSLFKRDRTLNDAALAAVMNALGGRRTAVIHAHAAIPARIGRQLGGPVLQTMHGWSRHKSAAHTAEDLAIMRDLNLVVFPSQASKDELTAFGATLRRTAIVPNGIAETMPDRMLPALADLAARRRAGTTVLLSIGSLTAQKNHAVIVEALPAITAVHDVVAVLIGEGPELERLRGRAAVLGVDDRVLFCGYQRDAAAALPAADVLIQPSLAESLGVVVIESFRAGVPVVASRIPALCELIGDGERGWGFDATASASLARAVSDVLSAPARDKAERVQRGRELFLDRFTDNRMIAAYDALYRSLG